MKAASKRESIGYAVLIFVLAILALRGFAGANEVFSNPFTDPAPEATGGQVLADIARSEERAHLAAVSEMGRRDPFRTPLPRDRRPAAVKPPAEPPQLTLIVDDGVIPTVLLEHEGAISGRLHVGDSFEGWRIEAIRENCVMVRNGDQSRVVCMSE